MERSDEDNNDDFDFEYSTSKQNKSIGNRSVYNKTLTKTKKKKVNFRAFICFMLCLEQLTNCFC